MQGIFFEMDSMVYLLHISGVSGEFCWRSVIQFASFFADSMAERYSFEAWSPSFSSSSCSGLFSFPIGFVSK